MTFVKFFFRKSFYIFSFIYLNYLHRYRKPHFFSWENGLKGSLKIFVYYPNWKKTYWSKCEWIKRYFFRCENFGERMGYKKRGKSRFTETQKSFMIKKINQGESTGFKCEPEEVAREKCKKWKWWTNFCTTEIFSQHLKLQVF